MSRCSRHVSLSGRARIAAAVGMVLIACGARTGFDAHPNPAADSGADLGRDSGAAAPDASPVLDATPGDAGPSPCAWNTPFDSVAPLPELGAAVEPRLSQDERTVYFYRAGDGGQDSADIFVAGRTDVGTPFGTPAYAADVSSPYFDGDPFLSVDGLSLFLNTDRPGTLGSTDIFVGRRSHTTSAFSPPVPVANVNSAAYDGTPYVTDDGSELWLATSRAGSIDLYRAQVRGSGFGPAAPVAELNTPEFDENNPVLMADGLTVYFSSNASGQTSVYVAHRSDAASPFGAPALVSEISTTGHDYASWISADGCRLYMTRLLTTAGVYLATRH